MGDTEKKTERKIGGQGHAGLRRDYLKPDGAFEEAKRDEGTVPDEKIEDVLERIPDFFGPYLTVFEPYSTQFLKWLSDPDRSRFPDTDHVRQLFPLELTKFPMDLSLHLYHRFLETTGLERIDDQLRNGGTVYEGLRKTLVDILEDDETDDRTRSRRIEPATNELKILRKRCRNLQELVETKESIIKETHHRAKNNIQVVISLLKLKRRKSDADPEKLLDQLLHTLRNIMSIHKKLQTPDGFEKRKLDLKPYLRDLSQSLVTTFTSPDDAVRLNVSVDDITVSMEDVVTIGLIVNELVMNSLQHGRGKVEGGNGEPLELSIEFTHRDGMARLRVADNGVGQASGSAKDAEDGGTSGGVDIVKKLAGEQLDGQAVRESGSSGMSWTITFPHSRLTSPDEQLGSSAPRLEFD